jgi:Zn-dependent alcohol dehydrogenase
MLDGTYRTTKGNQNVGKFTAVGSFSEYNVVNQESCISIDPDIPFEVAAVSGCAVLTGVGAVLNTAKVTRDSSVVVVGIGGIGLFIIQGAVLANATKIIAIDILDNKLEYARQLGATHLINSSREDPVKKVMEITNGFGADYAFEALGKSDTSQTAFSSIRRGGKAVIVGIPKPGTTITLPMAEFSQMEKNLCGCYYGSSNARADLKTYLNLYKAGRLKIAETITSRYSLDEINEGFNDMKSGKNVRGVVLMG